MILNNNFQNCYLFQMDALFSIYSNNGSFYEIVHIWTIDRVLFLDIHMHIRVPPNIDLIICGLVLFFYVGYYQSPIISAIHNCFRQKSVYLRLLKIFFTLNTAVVRTVWACQNFKRSKI